MSVPARTGDRLPPVLLAVFAIAWIASGIAPHYRQDWLLENVLVVFAVAWLVASRTRLPLRTGSYAALFVFLLLHEIGAHYTYSEVPYDAWTQRWLGVSVDAALGFERNHYDRLLHFLYGALVTPAARDVIVQRAQPRGAWRVVLPVAFVMSHSVLYELVEWAAALVFGGDLGVAYLGTQGDPWDAQRDMALATLGSLASMAVVLAVDRGRRR
ncbi:DUF2238 domain-containing protein [Cognatilysobacter tabacisoli]|uniref:DUF2238 domain-containing protein n=1 Tax=Cognatilysobacter tabacisoli TaxID=2315424 RepID=UPI000E6B1400|nr:DUF2238 domain-containing protein [Lysobacter tabacisoli]